jgi:peptidylprolyl isomerase
VPNKKSKREYGRSVPAALAAAGLIALAGCGGGKDAQPSPKPASTQPAETQATSTAPPPKANIKDTSQKPVIEKPTGAVPRKLKVKDIVKGKGPGAKAGDQMTVQYVGVTFSTGEQFDASWDSGQPFSFQLGGGQVIPGWDRGLKGMRKGGRRQLTIPPRLAYGAQGSPPAIGPNETLVFVVDLVDRR